MSAPAYSIELIEDPHGYRVNGEPKRSWSEIARAAGLVEPFPDHPAVVRNVANARARGAQVDDACSLIIEGKAAAVDLARLHAEALPYVQAFLDYWRRCQLFQSVSVQTPLYCAELDFCCTPDFHSRKTVADIKATDRPSRAWGLQTAAQWLAHGHADSRRVIWLRPKLKTRSFEEFLHGTLLPGDPRVFSRHDFDVVRAAAQGDYDAECIQRWKAGE